MSITGALILGFFATIWWIVGLQIADHSPALVYPLPLLAAVALAGVAWRLVHRQQATPEATVDANEHARRDKLVAWASALEGLALFFVAGVLLPSTGHRDLTVSAVALIVGAHFVPLARGLLAPAYYATAAALMGLGLVGLGIIDLDARITLVSAGAAVVLWLTAAWVLKRLAGSRAPGFHRPAA